MCQASNSRRIKLRSGEPGIKHISGFKLIVSRMLMHYSSPGTTAIGPTTQCAAHSIDRCHDRDRRGNAAFRCATKGVRPCF